MRRLGFENSRATPRPCRGRPWSARSARSSTSTSSSGDEVVDLEEVPHGSLASTSARIDDGFVDLVVGDGERRGEAQGGRR